MEAVVDPTDWRFILVCMKLGVISDVHGDLKALKRALDLLTTQHHVEGVWCAGDLVGRGKSPDEVVATIVQGEMPTVMGNHDEMVLTARVFRTGRILTLGEALGYRARTLHLLTTLPRTYRAQLDGHTLVMVHGSPRSNAEAISINPQNRQQNLAWLEKVGADILITGHTHAPMSLRGSRGLVVNPGSLFDPTGFKRSSSETYGVLDIAAMNFDTYALWD
jgi:putative phosphoesterase